MLIFYLIFIAPGVTLSNVIFSTSSTSITASWDDLPCRDRNGIIRYKPEFRDASGKLLVDIEVVGPSFTFNGLRPLSDYTFQVAVVNNDGIGPFTPIYGVSTDENENGMFNKDSCTILVLH